MPKPPSAGPAPSIIESLGLKDRGLGVVLSPKNQVTVRILPLAESYLTHERATVEANTSSEQIGSLADFDKYLNPNVKFEWRVPDIHIDFDTRQLLGVVPGQPVWVRREPVRLFWYEKVPLSIAPIILVILAVFATLFSRPLLRTATFIICFFQKSSDSRLALPRWLFLYWPCWAGSRFAPQSGVLVSQAQSSTLDK